ncbi:MAG: oxidoreductase [Chitinivibrionales bacterium]|nr:oxidoreductase [Chitinivibrionales bacterium]MBD3357467.1 oxidoreductase [Chitinivibrionales bacterium]
MILALWSRLRKVRLAISRGRITSKLLTSLTRKNRGRGKGRGLILLQIDGLSRPAMERALAEGKLPFMAKLLKREGYRLYSHYSGLPSSTPAVQGELFYGVSCAVPSFAFRDGETGTLTAMSNSRYARRLQERLAARGKPLLEGGSTYSNIYDGGASRGGFCFSHITPILHLEKKHPLRLAAVAALYSFIVLRMIGLGAIEVALAVRDFFMGVKARESLFKELEFIPSRVGICVLLRELVVAGAVADAVAGTPIIHANLAGYDEQAHRRGPKSAFARWTLKGIDDAARRIAEGAELSAERDYTVWIYSDHGQQQVLPYKTVTGYSIRTAVARAAEECGVEITAHREDTSGMALRRALLLWRKKRNGEPEHALTSDEIAITGAGPINHVYLPDRLKDHEVQRIAARLIATAGVPAVFMSEGPRVRVWTRHGIFRLPDDAEAVMGADHPFIDEAARDMVRLVHHPDAGRLVISGWSPGEDPISFPDENGAHAGYSPEETHGFAIVPRGAPIFAGGRGYIRPLDMRAAVMETMGAAPLSRPGPPRAWRRGRLRVMTYNTHSCTGFDGKVVPHRFAQTIAHYKPDIIALQEIDVGRARTDREHQAEQIARELDMHYYFHPCFTIEDEQYGIAVLGHLPMRLMRAGPLPGNRASEPRGALWIEVACGDTRIQFVNTHLGLSRAERRAQVEALLGAEWLANPRCTGPLILCGDFNMIASSPTYRLLRNVLVDAATAVPRDGHERTWMGLARLDYVFLSPDIRAKRVITPRNSLTRLASDHLPVIADIQVGTGEKKGESSEWNELQLSEKTPHFS